MLSDSRWNIARSQAGSKKKVKSVRFRSQSPKGFPARRPESKENDVVSRVKNSIISSDKVHIYPTRILKVLRSSDISLNTLMSCAALFGDFLYLNSMLREDEYDYLYYYDLRSAIKARSGLCLVQGSIRVAVLCDFVDTNELKDLIGGSGVVPSIIDEAKVLIITSPRQKISEDTVYEFCSIYGYVRLLANSANFRDGYSGVFCCEFYDTRDAHTFANQIHRIDNEEVYVRLDCSKDNGTTTLVSSHNGGSKGVENSYTLLDSESESGSEGDLECQNQVLLNEDSLLLKGMDRQQALKRGSLDKEVIDRPLKRGIVTVAKVPSKNQVDIERIAAGLDTRTTLMLRNIPNKVDQQMLKEYVDLTNAFTYDFLCKSMVVPLTC